MNCFALPARPTFALSVAAIHCFVFVFFAQHCFSDGCSSCLCRKIVQKVFQYFSINTDVAFFCFRNAIGKN